MSGRGHDAARMNQADGVAPRRASLRVLRVLTRPNLGGPTRQAIALWHALAERSVATLLVTGSVGAGETLLSPAAHGVPALTFDEALRAGRDAVGWLQIPELGRRLAPWADHRAARALRTLLRSHVPDVVHTHTSKAGWLGRRAARVVPGARLVHTFHGHVLQDYFPAPFGWLLARLERRLARCTDVLCAVSDSCADELAAAGVAPRARFVVVPPAVAVPPAMPRASARAALGIPPDQPRVVCAGRLVPIKRVGDFVAAVAQVAGLHGDVVGDGPEHAALAARAAAVAHGRVQLWPGRPSLPGELSAYDALVLPSVREGLPLVAVEAFAAGVPVVGYDVPGVRDVVRLGGGTLVPAAAGPAGLAAALQQLLADERVRAQAVAAGRAALARFAPAAVAAELEELYRAGRSGGGSCPAAGLD